MERCARAALDDAKRDLDRYVREARRVTRHRALLDSTQAAWEQFRAMACRAAGREHEGATIEPLVVANCIVDLSRKRVRELYEHYLRKMSTTLPEPGS